MRKSLMMAVIVLMAALVFGSCKNKNEKDNNNLLLLLSTGHEAMGLYDETFNTGGSGSIGFISALAVQKDGKILVGGDITTYNMIDVPDKIMRLNADGTIDTSFNTGGSGADSASDPYIYSIAIQDDGNIIIGGEFSTYNGNAVPYDIIRLSADGTRDTTFNTVGTGTDGTVNAILIQSDGKVLIGGSFTAYNSATAAPNNIMRLNADGSRDTPFNYGQAGTDGAINAIALQSDGRILIGGDFTTYNGIDYPNNIMRLNADGSPDPAFNNGGTGAGQTVNAIKVLKNRKILIGGSFTTYNGSHTVPYFIMRLNADGTADTSFNNAGVGPNNFVNSIAVQNNGKILIGGYFLNYNGSDVTDFIMRLNTDGTADTGFNTGGTGVSGYIRAIAVQKNGEILIGGAFGTYNGVDVPEHVIRLR